MVRLPVTGVEFHCDSRLQIRREDPFESSHVSNLPRMPQRKRSIFQIIPYIAFCSFRHDSSADFIEVRIWMELIFVPDAVSGLQDLAWHKNTRNITGKSQLHDARIHFCMNLRLFKLFEYAAWSSMMTKDFLDNQTLTHNRFSDAQQNNAEVLISATEEQGTSVAPQQLLNHLFQLGFTVRSTHSFSLRQVQTKLN